ncbi:nucleotidyltransferase domain-containing protein [Brevibacillus humidisoli]|uniref:nucleotidyltransferase domain-containing protein n=1 Tax=Brevibacillus humidisoli TaxID=2895522 RepID=UPI001E3E4879|nr:nucleotidyltransferase domain-containing protein [Brevibacillus humidisoli]UFJ41124.1 nucleotidyltransferase domain-containing protein [Brevibacillus humidisoli]
MADMTGTILHELQKIEQEERIRILYACESGSRAWGFPSKDSDYDVRFLYIRPVDWYLSIFDRRDVIERPIHEMLDISGWDLRKALQLFRKSNPSLLEWLQSPIVYLEQYSVANQIRALASLTYAPKSSVYHYLNMAKGNYRDYLQSEQVKSKKYFYVLRPILACWWIEQYGTMPPIQFHRLMEELLPDGSEVKASIEQLLIRKKAGEEWDVEPRIEPLHDFLEERIARYERLAANFDNGSAGSQDDQLDELFRAALREVWG